jgi:hypothetical protein
MCIGQLGNRDRRRISTGIAVVFAPRLRLASRPGEQYALSEGYRVVPKGN